MNVKVRLLDDEYPKKKKVCLGFEDYAKAFVKLAATAEEPMVFGIFGEWGTGKTTLMKTIEGLFKDPSFKNNYKKNVYPVWFNPWEYPSEESMVKALLHAMISNKDWFPKLTEKKPIITSICTLLKALTANVPFAPDTEKLLEIIRDSQKEDTLIPSSYLSLREKFNQLIDQLIKKDNVTEKDNGPGSDLMVFFIDDLDRCLPDKIVNILENIRLVFSLRNCVFFIGADRQIVADGIKYVYKNNTGFDGERYLEKMIHVPFFIPQNNNNKLKEYFENLDLEKEYNETLFEILKEVEANPRKIKRIVNSIILSWTTFTFMDSLETETKPTDLQIIKLLAILKVIELQWTVFFKDFAQKIGEEDKPILFRIKKLSEEEYDKSGDENTQPESIRKFLDKYQLKDQAIFNFFKKEIVKETLFDRKIIDKLPDYINSSRGFSKETESFSQNPEKISNEQLLKYLNQGEIDKFNQVRTRSNYVPLNFSGKDFSRIKNLKEVNFRNCKLLQANFKGCVLTKANFGTCDLQGADFSGADCTWVDFSEANIEMVNLNKTILRNAKFPGAELEGTNWWHAKELPDDVLDTQQRTQFKKPETEEEIKNWEDDFKIFHHLPLE